MAKLEIQRFAHTPKGVFGKMLFGDGTTSVYTLECPWKQNRPRVSCIPPGDYRVQERFYNRGGYQAVEICGVPQRSYILIHVANCVDELSGCVGVGFGLGVVHTQWAVVNSRMAFEHFMHWFSREQPERVLIDDRQVTYGDN